MAFLLRNVPWQSVMSDSHEFHPVPSCRVDRQHIPNARGIELVFEEIGFQRCGLLRFQAVMERASWHGDGLGQTKLAGAIREKIQQRL